MAVLNKSWGSITETPTGSKLLDKPMMIYVTDGPVAGFDKVEKVVLINDNVCIGMWAFECVKMTSADASKDSRLKATGEDVPRFVFVSRDMKSVDTVGKSKMSVKHVFKAMKKHAGLAYTTAFADNVKQMLDVLGEFDRINNAKTVLADAEAQGEASDADKRRFETEREALAERMKAAEKRRDELTTFELRALET